MAKILIVDDEKSNLMVYQRILEESLPEHEVLVSGKPEEAISLAIDNNIDAFVLDMMMPKINGIELCRQIKSHDKIQHLPVLILTSANVTKQMKYDAIESGALDFLARPLDILEFVTRVKIMIRIKENEDELRIINKSLLEQIDQKVKELQENHRQLIQADKMIALGTLVAGIAHEINNPVGAIKISLPLLGEVFENMCSFIDKCCKHHFERMKIGKMGMKEIRKEIPFLVDNIDKSADRIVKIVNDLKDFVRPEDSNVNVVQIDINHVLENSISLVKNKIKKSTDYFEVKYCKDLPQIAGNEQRLEQVLINLIINACEALENREQRITIESLFDNDKKAVVIRVVDDGVGIDSSIRDQIANPFFTTKRDYGGIGLGLAVSTMIMHAHKGYLNFISENCNGTVVEMVLPVV